MSTLQALLLPSDFIGLCELFLLYIAYSVLGWCGEMLYCSIPKGHICEKRGFLNGFLCPIYGHGALLVLYCLHGGFKNPVLTFIFGAIVTSVLEYFTSWIMEKLFHMRWWDYSHYKFQINGRVCLLNSACFGLASVLLCHVVQPWLWAHITGLGAAITVPLASFIFGIYLMDTILSIRSAFQLSHRLDKLQKIQQEIRQHLDEKAQLYGNRVEELTGRLMNGLEKASDEYLQERMLRLAQLRSGADMFERRLLRSHPNLRSKRHGSKLIDVLRQKKDGVVKK
mgnify:CR=1 FL=1